MKFLRTLLRAYRHAKLASIYEWIEDESQSWDNDVDGKNLTVFFNSDTGLKLKREISNYVMTSAVNACAQATNNQHHAGIATGIRICFERIQDLFYDPQASPKPVTPGKDGETTPAIPVMR